MKSKIWLLSLLFNHCLVASASDTCPNAEQCLPLSQEECNEITSSNEPYTYIGSDACTLIQNISLLERHLSNDSAVSCNHIKMLCSYSSQGKRIAPTALVEAALQE